MVAFFVGCVATTIWVSGVGLRQLKSRSGDFPSRRVNGDREIAAPCLNDRHALSGFAARAQIRL